MISKKRPISANDRALFQDAVKDVLPLKQDKILPFHRHLPPIPKQQQLDDCLVIQDMMSDVFQSAEIETGDELLYLRPELQKRLLHHLRRGKFSIPAELDLHGMNVPTARYALASFLSECEKRNIRSVRIIHGKGRGSHHKEPILKGKVNTWLQQRGDVLAFCSALSTDGGTGAVYVLLRRSK